MFHRENARLLYELNRLHKGILLYFYSYKKPRLVLHYSYLIRQVTSCFGYLRYYAYFLYESN